jgi:hypothetical protein
MFANAAAPQTKAEHIAVAEKYEKMAAEQDAVAQEHNQMLEDYKANAAKYPKQVREKRIAEMKKHCTAIIRTSKQIAKEYRDMAHWHRMVAADLVDDE